MSASLRRGLTTRVVGLRIMGRPMLRFRSARAGGAFFGRHVRKHAENPRPWQPLYWGFDWVEFPGHPEFALVNTQNVLGGDINMLDEREKAVFSDAFRRGLRGAPQEWTPGLGVVERVVLPAGRA